MYNQNFNDAISLVRSVSKEILSWRSHPSFKILHNPAEFKTEADIQAHKLLKQGLSSMYPSVPIVSEEDLSRTLTRPRDYWLIDPIDGTASWFNGFDGFVCQAAYISMNTPVFGVISAPALDTVWHGIRGSFAYRNGVKLRQLDYIPRLIITDNTPAPHGISRFLSSHLDTTGYHESGSIGLKAVLVADGTADLFVKDVVVRDWDLAPAAVILSEVCGVFTQLNGMAYEFCDSYQKNNGILVARDSSLAGEVVSALQNYHD